MSASFFDSKLYDILPNGCYNRCYETLSFGCEAAKLGAVIFL